MNNVIELPISKEEEATSLRRQEKSIIAYWVRKGYPKIQVSRIIEDGITCIRSNILNGYPPR